MQLPDDVQRAFGVFTVWLDSLLGQDRETVREALGEPDDEFTWEFDGGNHPALLYRLDDESKLKIHFLDGRVLTTSVHRMTVRES